MNIPGIKKQIMAYSLNIALQNFFQVFNEYINNDFYITGISYAGIYIPYLVKEIIKNENLKLNLKGILIGNPYTHEETDYEDTIVEFCFTHGLISYPTFKKYLKHCPHLPQKEQIIKGDYENDVEYEKYYYEDKIPMKNVTKRCNEIRTEIHEQMHESLCITVVMSAETSVLITLLLKFLCIIVNN